MTGVDMARLLVVKCINLGTERVGIVLLCSDGDVHKMEFGRMRCLTQ